MRIYRSLAFLLTSERSRFCCSRMGISQAAKFSSRWVRLGKLKFPAFFKKERDWMVVLATFIVRYSSKGWLVRGVRFERSNFSSVLICWDMSIVRETQSSFAMISSHTGLKSVMFWLGM